MRGVAAVLLVAVVVVSGAAAKPKPKPKKKHTAPTLTALAPPPAGSVYLGLTYRLWDTSDPAYGDSRPFATRLAETVATELGGKTPAFLSVYVAWGDTLASHAADLAKATGGGLAYLDWTLSATTRDNDGPTVADVAAGREDAYVRTFAAELRQYGKPVLIRLFGGEFNGSWWWGQSPLANPALTPATFVAAWQRVVTLVRDAGAKNVSFAWIPQAVTAAPVSWADNDLAAYYPGDAFVDWAGADEYDSQPVDALDTTYAFAVAHGKPFFLAEWGVRHPASSLTPTEQRTWIATMFDYIAAHPDIAAAAYFDYDNRPGLGVGLDPSKTVAAEPGVTYQRDTNDGDHRLLADSGAGWPALVAARVSSPTYLSKVLARRP